MKFILASVFVLEVFCQALNKFDFDITKFLPTITHGLVPVVPEFKTEVKNYTEIYPSLRFTDKDYELIRAKIVDPKVFRSLLVENTVIFDEAGLSIKAPEVDSEILSLTKIVKEGCLEEVNKLIELFEASMSESSKDAKTSRPKSFEEMVKHTESTLDAFKYWFKMNANFPSYVNTLFLATRPAYNKEFAKVVKMFIQRIKIESPQDTEIIKNQLSNLQSQFSFIPDMYYNILKDPYFT